MAKKIIGIIAALAVVFIIVWVVRHPEVPAPEEVVEERTEGTVTVRPDEGAAADSAAVALPGADTLK